MPKIVDKEEKRAEILAAAIRVLAKKGTAGTKIQNIAEEAGVGKGTVYLYFKNKEDIFQHILMQKAPAGNEIAQNVLLSSMTPHEKLKTLFQKLAENTENQSYPPEIQMEIFTNLIRGPGKGELSKEAVAFRDTIAEIVNQIDIKESQYDSKTIASGLLSLIHGVLMMWIIDKKEFPIQKMTEITVEAVLNGIKSSGSD